MFILTRMTSSIKAKLYNQKEGQTSNYSCRVSELNLQNINVCQKKYCEGRILLKDILTLLVQYKFASHVISFLFVQGIIIQKFR